MLKRFFFMIICYVVFFNSPASAYYPPHLHSTDYQKLKDVYAWSGTQALVDRLPVIWQQHLKLEYFASPSFQQSFHYQILWPYTSAAIDNLLLDGIGNQLTVEQIDELHQAFQDPLMIEMRELEYQNSAPNQRAAYLAYQQKIREYHLPDERLNPIEQVLKNAWLYQLVSAFHHESLVWMALLKEQWFSPEALLVLLNEPSEVRAQWWLTQRYDLALLEEDIRDYALFTYRTVANPQLEAYAEQYQQPIIQLWYATVELQMLHVLNGILERTQTR